MSAPVSAPVPTTRGFDQETVNPTEEQTDSLSTANSWDTVSGGTHSGTPTEQLRTSVEPSPVPSSSDKPSRSMEPSGQPTRSAAPSVSIFPSGSPSAYPSRTPSTGPSSAPSITPTQSLAPSTAPTSVPTLSPTFAPTLLTLSPTSSRQNPNRNFKINNKRHRPPVYVANHRVPRPPALPSIVSPTSTPINESYTNDNNDDNTIDRYVFYRQSPFAFFLLMTGCLVLLIYFIRLLRLRTIRASNNTNNTNIITTTPRSIPTETTTAATAAAAAIVAYFTSNRYSYSNLLQLSLEDYKEMYNKSFESNGNQLTLQQQHIIMSKKTDTREEFTEENMDDVGDDDNMDDDSSIYSSSFSVKSMIRIISSPFIVDSPRIGCDNTTITNNDNIDDIDGDDDDDADAENDDASIYLSIEAERRFIHLSHDTIITTTPTTNDRNEPQLISGTCIICFEDYQQDDVIVFSNDATCSHIYHQDCMVQYLASMAIQKRSRRHTAVLENPCPTCRRTNYCGGIPDEDVAQLLGRIQQQQQQPQQQISTTEVNVTATPAATTITSISTSLPSPPPPPALITNEETTASNNNNTTTTPTTTTQTNENRTMWV